MMKNKTILALFAIFLIACSVSAVQAEQGSLGNIKFNVPDDYKISESNDTTVIMKNDQKQIIVSTVLTDSDSLNNYMEGQGFKYDNTMSGNMTVSGNDLNGKFSFVSLSYTKDKGCGIAYLLNKDGTQVSVIGIDNDADSDSIGSMDIESDVKEVAQEVMLRK